MSRNIPVLFESAPIIEYLDEMSPPSLHPANPVIRALHRGYYSVSSDINMVNKLIFFSTDYKTYLQNNNKLQTLLAVLEKGLNETGPYFSGRTISLVDLVFAPPFLQINHMQRYSNLDLLEKTPKVKRYSETLLNLDCIREVTPKNYQEFHFERATALGQYYIHQKQRPLVVSLPLCPYAARVRTLLEHKRVPYDSKFLDKTDQPDWIKTQTPLGKVPIMKVGNDILFESNAILEYIDEIYDTPQLPQSSIDRARVRAWMGVANELQSVYFPLRHTNEPKQVEAILAKGSHLLSQLESQLSHSSKYFSGNEFSLIDAAFAPALYSLKFYEEVIGKSLTEAYNKVHKYRELLEPHLRKALVPNYDESMRAEVRKTRSSQK